MGRSESGQQAEAGHGYLFKHLRTQRHLDKYNAICSKILNKRAGSRTLQFPAATSKKARAACKCLDWITTDNLALEVCEKPTNCKYSEIDNISEPTLKKYMHLTSEYITECIKRRSCGLCLTAGRMASTHYVGLIAIYCDANGVSRSLFIAFAPRLDETDLGADSHRDFLVSTLVDFDSH